MSNCRNQVRPLASLSGEPGIGARASSRGAGPISPVRVCTSELGPRHQAFSGDGLRADAVGEPARVRHLVDRVDVARADVGRLAVWPSRTGCTRTRRRARCRAVWRRRRCGSLARGRSDRRCRSAARPSLATATVATASTTRQEDDASAHGRLIRTPGTRPSTRANPSLPWVNSMRSGVASLSVQAESEADIALQAARGPGRSAWRRPCRRRRRGPCP